MMRSHTFCFAIFLFLFSLCISAQDRAKEKEIVKPADYAPLVLKGSPELKEKIDAVVGDLINSYRDGGFKPDEIAVTVIDLRDAADLKWAHYRGEERIYPASVVKIFYMAALHQQVQDGKITMTRELERGLRDMIVVSSNEATQYILDVLTDTSSGSELPQKEFDEWQYKRNRVNRFFASMGYMNININQKTFCEDAYGIEQQSRNYKGENRNMLTSNASARLIAEIALGRSVNAERSGMMMGLLKRDPFATGKETNSQATDFTGKALIDKKMAGAKLFSKAGWTSRTRHDTAYVETPDGLKFAIAIFTQNHSNEKNVIPTVAAAIIDKLKEEK